MTAVDDKSLFPINLKTLTDKERHEYILNTFVLNKANNAESSRHKRDVDVIVANHRFLWDDDEDAEENDGWEQRLARRYYDKLFKEYCIADLTRHKENKVALRWRTEAEVVAGVGQFQCGSRKCTINESLRTWEVNFAYLEQGLRKNALVKLRLCPEHSSQLNYSSKKREVKRLKEHQKEKRRQEKRAQKGDGRNRHEHKTKKRRHSEATEAVDEVVIETIDPTISDNKEPKANDADFLPPDNETDDVWRKQMDVPEETTSREHEFERYLEDLFL